jgi:hypothetical protein
MAIIINDTATVKSKSSDLISEAVKIESVKDSIDYVLNELNEYWNATQEDQQIFYNGLKSSVAELEIIHTCNQEFANAMIEYMEVTDKTSAKTL